MHAEQESQDSRAPDYRTLGRFSTGCENRELRRAHYRPRRFLVASNTTMVASTMVIAARKMVISSPPRLDDPSLAALAPRVSC
jgi:hypothetical protein